MYRRGLRVVTTLPVSVHNVISGTAWRVRFHRRENYGRVYAEIVRNNFEKKSESLIYICIYGAETWTLRAVDQKHLESFEMWCWRRMEKISWTYHVKNVEVLLRVKEQRNILHEIRKWKANWIGHILRRNCLLQRVIEGKIQGGIEVAGRLGRRRRKLLNYLKERRGYFHLKEEALDRTMWTAGFGRGFGPVVRPTTT
jgi:hypothetical protein